MPERSCESLAEAMRIQEEASSQGFDWDSVDGVIAKLSEELHEIESALAENDLNHAKSELGDLLFAVVNLARFLDADPAEELRGSNQRFLERFVVLQTKLDEAGRFIKECSVEELDIVWQEVKTLLGRREKKA